MKHLERFKKSINRQPLDRIPLNYVATKEMQQALNMHLNLDEEKIRYNYFDVDRRSAMPVYKGPEPQTYNDGSYNNIFGVRMKNQNYGKGTYSESIGHPLSRAVSVKEIENHPWPKAEDYDYSIINNLLIENPDYAFTVGYQAIGWFSWEMRGMSQFLEDLMLNSKIAEAIICNISNFAYQYYQKIIETARNNIDNNFVCIHLADDWATQNGLLISPDLFRKYFKAHYRRIIDMAHQAGLFVEFHCCGSVFDLIPELIDIGIDILNPIQTSAYKMDPRTLKNQFGKYLAFSGGVDVQQVLPFYNVQEIKDEVKFLLDELAYDGGYFLEPSHAIQIGTPPENVCAMFEAAYEYYGLDILSNMAK